MIHNVEIKNRVARYMPSEQKYVCGNSGDVLKIVFDEEWAEHEEKTARFIWNGKYYDVEFTGDAVEIPVITNAKFFYVGVYVGEAASGEELLSTTYAIIPCELSVRCVANTANNGTGANYTNEAKGYAADAKKSAEQAEEATAQLETYKGMEKVGTLSVTVELGYDSASLEESQIGGVGIMDGILPLYAEYQATGFLIVNTYKDAIKGIFENARIVELTIDKNNSIAPVENPIHKEMCKGGHMWYGTPKLIEDDMYGEVIGMGVNDLNEGTHLAYAVDVEDSEHTELLGLALSKGALLRIKDIVYFGGNGEEVTLNFTAYR